MPPIAAAAYDHLYGGLTDPSTILGCTLCCHLAAYPYAALNGGGPSPGGVGKWLSKSSSTLLVGNAGFSPYSATGTPVFDGITANSLGLIPKTPANVIAPVSAMFGTSGATKQGTIFVVVKPLPNQASGGSGNEFQSPGILAEAVDQHFGLGYSSANGLEAYVFDGAYHHAYSALAGDGQPHSGMMRWRDGGTVDVQTDGGPKQSTPIGVWTTSGARQVDVGFAGGGAFTSWGGTMLAIALFNVAVDDPTANALYQWAKWQFGTP